MKSVPARALVAASVIAASLFFAASPPAKAIPGDVDVTFADGGFVADIGGIFTDAAYSVVGTASGKFYAAGMTGTNMGAAAFYADGSPMGWASSYPVAGTQSLDMGTNDDAAYASVLDADSRLVMAGVASGDVAVARLNASGNPDNTFDGDGRVVVDLGADDYAVGIAVLGTGKLLVAGESGTNTFLLRLNSDGSRDTTFGTNGVVVHNLEGSPAALAMHGDKPVVAGGTASDGMVARFLANGSLDTAFSTDGIATIDLGTASDFFTSVVIDASGRPVAAGESDSAFGVARFTTAGAPDAGFGAAGGLRRDLGGDEDIPAGVVVLGDGTVVVGGTSQSDFVLAAFTSAGAVLSSFGTNGVARQSVGQDDFALSLSLSPDGRLLMGGESDSKLAVAAWSDSGVPNMGTQGYTTVDFGDLDYGYSVDVRSNGSVVVAGTTRSDSFLVGLTSSGAVDTAFGNGGLVLTAPLQFVQSVVEAANGDLLVAGMIDWKLAMARYNADGTVDTGFGDDGVVVIESVDARAGSVAELDDGRIVLAGGAGSVGPVVARLHADGSFDTTFHGDGVREGDAAISGQYSLWGAITPTTGGKLLLGGYVVARLNADGSLDTSFSGDGWMNPDDIFSVPEIAVRPDGRIVVGGEGSWFYVAQLLSDGTPDPSFGGGDGLAQISGGPAGTGTLVGLKLLSDGKALLGGHFSGRGMGLARINPDGSPDTSFGGQGSIVTDATDGISAMDMAIQPDGKPILAGTYTDFNVADMAVVRFTMTNQDGPPNPPGPPPPSQPRSGYWMLGSEGRVYPFGSAAFYGDPKGRLTPGATAVAITPTTDFNGYWVVDSKGGVFGYGTAPFHGGQPALAAGERVTSISGTADNGGYWLFTSFGRAIRFGNAGHYKDMAGTPLNGPVLGSVRTAGGAGYYMVASDGGIFAFGDAVFHGSMGGKRLNGPVVGLAPDPDLVGYWLVANDGGIFAFDARFKGSMGGKPLNRPVIGMVAYGDGYLMVASDGGIFNFSSKPFAGSLGSSPPLNPIVGVAALNE